MPRLFAYTAAALALVLVAAAPAAHAGVKAGDRASEFSNVKDRRGKKLQLRQLRGKVVVLTFGASWCKPCKKELPAYDKIAKKYRGVKDVEFVAINIDSERANADAFLKETGVKHMRIGFDPNGSTVERYEPATMPTTYIIDGNGIVRDVHNGYEKGDEAKIRKLVEKLRKKK